MTGPITSPNLKPLYGLQLDSTYEHQTRSNKYNYMVFKIMKTQLASFFEKQRSIIQVLKLTYLK